MLNINTKPNEMVAASDRAEVDGAHVANDFSNPQLSDKSSQKPGHPVGRGLACGIILLLVLIMTSIAARAHEVDGGSTNGVNGSITNGVDGVVTNDLTARFEIEFLRSSIDHHFASLRMTELAAGTDPSRDADIVPEEGTSPTPGTNATPVTAKATLDEIKSLARANNRIAREEILKAQRLLREWYGIEHDPQISEVNQARIQILEVTPAGDEFNHAFLEVFSRHQFTITLRAVEAIVSSNLDHEALRRMSRNILETHMNAINEMRELLCREFEICDFQPYVGVKGKHTGDAEELDPSFSQFDEITADEDEDGGKHLADPTSDDDTNGDLGETPIDPVDPVDPVQPVQPVQPPTVLSPRPDL